MRIAFVFPGQGSQVVGMGKDFYGNFKESKLVFEEASDAIRVNLKKLCFDGPLDELTKTPNLQPALFTVEAAMWAALRANVEIQPTVVAGHSLGEYSALYACGSLKLETGATLTRLRGQAMQDAVPLGTGTMAAILGLSAELVDALCTATRSAIPAQPKVPIADTVEPANYNAPGQVVIAGTVAGVAAAVALLKTDERFKGGKSIPLQVSAPFHCSLMLPAQKIMAKPLATTRFERPLCPLIANVSAEPIESEHSFAGLLEAQITKPVRWEASMQRLRALGIEKVIELGPGKVLSGLMKRIDRELPVVSISSLEQFQESFE